MSAYSAPQDRLARTGLNVYLTGVDVAAVKLTYAALVAEGQLRSRSAGTRARVAPCQRASTGVACFGGPLRRTGGGDSRASELDLAVKTCDTAPGNCRRSGVSGHRALL